MRSLYTLAIVLSLVVILSPPVSGGDEQGPSSARTAYAKLRQVDPAVRGLYDSSTGCYRIVSGRLTPQQGGDKRSVAEEFLLKYGRLFGLPASNISSLQFLRSEDSRNNGPTYLTYQQSVNGVPLYGAFVVVAIDQTRVIRSISSTYIPNAPGKSFSVLPKYSPEQTRKVLALKIPPSAENKGLFAYFKRDSMSWYLVWHMISVENAREYFVDANTAVIVNQVVFTRYDDDFPKCVPTITEWNEITLPVCRDDVQSFLLYAGPGYKLGEFAVLNEKDDIYNPWPPKNSIENDEFIKYDWPINPEATDFDALNLRVHADMERTLEYFDSVHDQQSYGECDGKPCPVYLHSIPAYAAFYNGGGHIYLNNNLGIDSPAHEFAHAAIWTNYKGERRGYCDKTYPETMGIEEGVVELFAQFVVHHYYLDWTVPTPISITYQKAKDLVTKNDPPSDFCYAHNFGDIIFRFAELLLFGQKLEVGPEWWKGLFMNIDANHLLTHKQVAWLFMETLRYETGWMDDMKVLSNAVLATCLERVGILFEEEQCKNVVRAFKVLGIEPEGGGDVALLPPHKAAIYIDFEILPPIVATAFKGYTMQKLRVDIVLKDGQIFGLNTKLGVINSNNKVINEYAIVKESLGKGDIISVYVAYPYQEITLKLPDQFPHKDSGYEYLDKNPGNNKITFKHVTGR